MKKEKINIVIVLIVLLFSTPIFAQLPGFDDNVDDEGTSAAPIDGFVGLALVAGAFYGAKKLKRKSNI
ncbi:PID-CTERM protein-sorting domain-containing protein [Mesonia maritima]|nr:hypothetical protein [Mesonia maritima]